MEKSKRQRVMDLVEGRAGSSDYVPAAFFLHFGEEYEVGQAAIDKHLDYFRFTGMDFVKIQYEAGFPERPQIQKPADWAAMPLPGKEFYEAQLEVVSGLVKAAGKEAPVIVTLYSPFMLACHAVPAERVVAHIEEDPEATRKGIEIAAQSLLIFVRACIDLGVDGFYASTQGGERGRFSRPELFAECVRPFDLAIWEKIDARCSFNILHICDYHLPYDDLTPFLDYPGHVVNCPLHLAGETLSPRRVEEMFGRPSMGGIDRKGTIVTGSHEEVRAEVEGLLGEVGEHYILGADCTLPGDADWEKIRTAIAVAHEHAG